MAITTNQVQQARDEAIRFLEYSIFTLAVLLAVDIDDVSGDMPIPVGEDHHEYVYYESLKKQAGILEGLTG